MRSKGLISSALFAALTFTQTNNYNINAAEETKVIQDIENFITTLEASPAFQTDVSSLLKDIPASVLSEAESDPEAFIEALAATSTLPAWVTAVPTSVLGSLETLAAKPLEAVSDVEHYISSLIEEPAASSVLSVLLATVPTTVENAFETEPISFVENLVTATALPAWASNIPAPLQSDIGSVVNEALSIIDSDLEGTAPTATATGVSSGFWPTVVYANPTGTGSVLAFNGSQATGSPIAFAGAATPMKTVAVGAVAFFAGAGIVFNL